MKTLFGLPLNFKKLSDDDFIEFRRDSLRRDKRFAWVWLFGFVVAAFGIPFLNWTVSHIVHNMPGPTAQYAGMGLKLGVSVGLTISIFLLQAATGIVNGFNLFGRNRDTELLLTYHDKIKKMAKQQTCESGPRG